MPAHLCQHDGKLYVSRLVRSRDPIGTSPFVTLHIQAGMTLMGLIKVVACSYEDLAECWEHTPWWVVPIHKSCAKSPSKIFRSQHLLLILGEDYWHFRLRPQGIIEMVCGEGSLQFVTTLPKNANKEIVLDLLAAVLPPPNLQFLIRMWAFRARLPRNFTEQASKTSVLRDASDNFTEKTSKRIVSRDASDNFHRKDSKRTESLKWKKIPQKN